MHFPVAGVQDSTAHTPPPTPTQEQCGAVTKELQQQCDVQQEQSTTAQ